jgi:hypothetical protein
MVGRDNLKPNQTQILFIDNSFSVEEEIFEDLYGNKCS